MTPNGYIDLEEVLRDLLRRKIASNSSWQSPTDVRASDVLMLTLAMLVTSPQGFRFLKEVEG